MSLEKKIDSEMLVHVPLTVYPNAKKVLVLHSENLEQDELKKHNCEVESALKDEEKSVDVVIAGKFVKDEVLKIYRVLKEDGIAVFSSYDWYKDTGALKEEIKLLDLFRFVMPYRYENIDGSKNIIFVSKKYHPTADMRLHCADMLDDLEFYNADLHKASFVMPNFVYNDCVESMKL